MLMDKELTMNESYSHIKYNYNVLCYIYTDYFVNHTSLILSSSADITFFSAVFLGFSFLHVWIRTELQTQYTFITYLRSFLYSLASG